MEREDPVGMMNASTGRGIIASHNVKSKESPHHGRGPMDAKIEIFLFLGARHRSRFQVREKRVH